MGIGFGFEQSASNQFLSILAARPGVELRLLRDTPLESQPDVPVITLSLPLRKLPGILRTVCRLLQAVAGILRHKIDFVHGIHLWPQGFLAFISAKITGRKCAITIVAGSREVGLKGGLLQRAALYCLKNCDAVIVTGEQTRDHLIANQVSPSLIRVIPNLADMDHFKPASESSRRYDVVSTSRLYSVKNVETTLRALAIARETMPDLKAAIGGKGPERERLETLAADLKLGDGVEFLGYMEDVADVLNQGRLCILTSRSEGFPISILEAMACGLPCIVSNVGDMAEVAKHDWNAMVIDDCEDAPAFAAALLAVLGNAERESRLSRNALRVRETHSFEAASQAWAEVLEKMSPK